MLVYFCSLFEQTSLFLVVVIPVLIGVAYYTLAERKILSAMQRRLGPNVVGYWGLFQPLADGLKLVIKQTIVPNIFTFYNIMKKHYIFISVIWFIIIILYINNTSS